MLPATCNLQPATQDNHVRSARGLPIGTPMPHEQIAIAVPISRNRNRRTTERCRPTTDAPKRDAAACTVRRVPADDIESAVIDQQRGLLRPCRQRPCRRRAAEEGDELTAFGEAPPGPLRTSLLRQGNYSGNRGRPTGVLRAWRSQGPTGWKEIDRTVTPSS